MACHKNAVQDTYGGQQQVIGQVDCLPHTGGVDTPLLGPLDAAMIGAIGLALALSGWVLRRIAR